MSATTIAITYTTFGNKYIIRMEEWGRLYSQTPKWMYQMPRYMHKWRTDTSDTNW
jgi:hypothetical protein